MNCTEQCRVSGTNKNPRKWYKDFVYRTSKNPDEWNKSVTWWCLVKIVTLEKIYLKNQRMILKSY